MNTKCFHAILIFGLCGGFAEAALQSQEPQPLSMGAPIERELPGGQTHIYRIALSAGQFALVQVEQRGANVTLTANAPDGKEFAAVDLRWGNEGVESLAILAEAAGEYTLKVTSRNPRAASGRYEVKISELRAATEQDRARVKAQTISYEARALSLETAPESKRKAVRLYEEAALLWRRVPDPLWESALLWRLGRLHIDLTEFRQAKDYFSRALTARKAIGDRSGEATAQSGVCESLHYLGDIKGKAECIDALIPIYRELGDRLEEAKALSNKSVAYNSLGDYQAALETMRQALRIFQSEGDRLQESFALNTLGQIYRSLNEQQLALDHYERALAIRREGTNKRLLGLTLGDIGMTYYDLGDFPRAIDYLRQSLAISEEIGDRRTKAIRLQALGLIWKKMGETAKALDAQTQSLALAREVGDRLAEGRTLIAVGELYLILSEKEKARDSITQALEIARDIGDPVGEASVLTRMGKMAADSGDWRQAIDLLQQSLSLARKTGDLQRERDALVALAQTERERNNLSEARDYHEKALDLTESIRAKTLRQELRASFLASRQEEYELYIDLLMQLHQRQPDAGHAAAAFGISERGRARSLLETLAEARADIRQGVDVALLAEERELADRIRLKEQQRAQLTGNSRAAKQTEDLAKEIEDLLNEYQSLQARIRASSPRYSALTQPQPSPAAEIQTQCLDSHTVLLEFALGAKRSWLWAITPDAITGYTLPPRAEIETSARKIYELLTARSLRKRGETPQQQRERTLRADALLPEAAKRLSEMVLGSVADQLGNKRLIIVADGALQYVPFAMLPEPVAAGQQSVVGEKTTDHLPPTTNYQPLNVNHEIISLPSASTLAFLRREMAGRKPAPKLLAVIADPVFTRDDARFKSKTIKIEDRTTPETEAPADTRIIEHLSESEVATISPGRLTIPRLPFTRQEAERILAAAPAGANLKALDFRANRGTATSAVLGQYRYLHFATHGLLDSERPGLSALVLSLVDERGATQDGFLRAHDIYNLNLPADLVVLSACQTGLGKEIKGEGLVGLTRGFMYAGAARVMVSLWNVNDKATAELMAKFYQKMLKDGQSPAAALRSAQVEMWRQRQWQSPYYWAAFTLQGEWR